MERVIRETRSPMGDSSAEVVELTAEQQADAAQWKAQLVKDAKAAFEKSIKEDIDWVKTRESADPEVMRDVVILEEGLATGTFEGLSDDGEKRLEYKKGELARAIEKAGSFSDAELVEQRERAIEQRRKSIQQGLDAERLFAAVVLDDLSPEQFVQACIVMQAATMDEFDRRRGGRRGASYEGLAREFATQRTAYAQHLYQLPPRLQPGEESYSSVDYVLKNNGKLRSELISPLLSVEYSNKRSLDEARRRVTAQRRLRNWEYRDPRDNEEISLTEYVVDRVSLRDFQRLGTGDIQDPSFADVLKDMPILHDLRAMLADRAEMPTRPLTNEILQLEKELAVCQSEDERVAIEAKIEDCEEALLAIATEMNEDNTFRFSKRDLDPWTKRGSGVPKSGEWRLYDLGNALVQCLAPMMMLDPRVSDKIKRKLTRYKTREEGAVELYLEAMGELSKEGEDNQEVDRTRVEVLTEAILYADRRDYDEVGIYPYEKEQYKGAFDKFKKFAYINKHVDARNPHLDRAGVDARALAEATPNFEDLSDSYHKKLEACYYRVNLLWDTVFAVESVGGEVPPEVYEEMVFVDSPDQRITFLLMLNPTEDDLQAYNDRIQELLDDKLSPELEVLKGRAA